MTEKKKNPSPVISGADAEAVLAEAEAIRRGEDVNVVAGPTSAGNPADHAASPAAEPPAAGPAADSDTLAELALVLADQGFVYLFGRPEAKLAGPLRDEAKKAWAAVIAQYAPMLQTAGPLGALGGIYLAHGLICYSTWTSAPLPESSANVEVGKPLS